eukprot:TRINITY_DN28000_c0_g1_i1.p1 TRINITY_DN28000_c0_g1~~TRINITY_DN28000_c0_g1_i1.p1  ORF type:complete len:352 (-),score=44.61 TRINITY_DN28000_c0_g1_i1:310-1365(-)
MSDLLVAPLAPPTVLASDALLFCFDFGFGTDEASCATNVALASFIVGTLYDGEQWEEPCDSSQLVGNLGRRPPRILAQSEIARELDDLGIQVAFVATARNASRREDAAAAAAEVLPVLDPVAAALAEFSEEAPCSIFGGTPVTIVAHPSHSWRCWALTTLAGYRVTVPNMDESPNFAWQRFGCDPLGFDPAAEDSRVRSEEAWCTHERFLQCQLRRQYPALAAPHLAGRRKAGRTADVSTRMSSLEILILQVICCACLPGWQERVGSSVGGTCDAAPAVRSHTTRPDLRYDSAASTASREFDRGQLRGNDGSRSHPAPRSISPHSNPSLAAAAGGESDADSIIPVWHARTS